MAESQENRDGMGPVEPDAMKDRRGYVNDTYRFYLTPRGRKIRVRLLQEERDSLRKYGIELEEIEDTEVVKMQFWQAIAMFGLYFSMGTEAPFTEFEFVSS